MSISARYRYTESMLLGPARSLASITILSSLIGLTLLPSMSFAQTPTGRLNSLDSIMSEIKRDTEPSASKPAAKAKPTTNSNDESPAVQAALSKIEENEKRKRAALAAAARSKEETLSLAAAVTVANRAVNMKPGCSPNAHSKPDMDFRDPIAAPGGDLWQYGVDSFNTKGWTRVNAMQFDLTSIARQSQFPKPTHEMTTTVVVEREIGWTASEIVQTMAKTAGLLAKCGIQMKLNVVNANPPNVNAQAGMNVFRDIDADAGKSLVARTPIKERPILYFVRKRIDPEADGSGHAFALTTGITNMVSSKRDIGTGTAFFGRDAAVKADNVTPIDRQAVGGDRLVVPVMHELAHLLADRDHVGAMNADGSPNTTPNILQGQTRYLSADITSDQCADFKANTDYVKPMGAR